jgi:hypothetical protein
MSVLTLLLIPALFAQAPAGLDLVLRGAQPVMSLEAFRLAHPGAREVETPDAAPPAPRSLAESFEKDTLLGLECHANYGFKEDILVEFVVLWGGPQEAVKGKLRAFLEACTWKHGRQFRKDVMQVNPRAENPTLVPVLVWETDQGVYLASLAWNPDSQRAPGTLTYALYQSKDSFLDIVLLGDELAPEVIQDAHAEIQPILSEIAAVGVVPAEK